MRIVRYLAGLGVPINLATVQHFRDSDGREFLAQVYLIEPEEVRPRVRGSSARSMYRTVNQLQALADENGIGEVYRRLRDGVRGIFTANGYSRTVGYVRRLDNGGVRTLMLVGVVPGDDAHGMKFTVHATRFERYMGMGMEDLRDKLPENTAECDVRGWSGSSAEERESAEGLRGFFRNTDGVERFVAGLRDGAGWLFPLLLRGTICPAAYRLGPCRGSWEPTCHPRFATPMMTSKPLNSSGWCMVAEKYPESSGSWK